jgi:polar amino acid transport system permease protein
VSIGADVDASKETPNFFAPWHRRLFVGRRGLVASTFSSLLVLAAIALLLFASPGGATFRHVFFDGHNLWRAWVGDPSQGIDALRDGMVTNIWMFLVSEVLVLFFGLAIASCRISQSPVLFPFRVLATTYTDIMRGVPLILTMLIVGFGLPELELPVISSQSAAVYGVVALTLCYSAYVAEVIRAGIYSVPNGQRLAARSLGLTQASTMRRVILPQAIRNVIPPLLNDFISLQKDTAIVSVLGAIEVVRSAEIYSAATFNESGLTLAAVFFIVLTIPMTRFTDRLMSKDRAKRLAHE